MSHADLVADAADLHARRSARRSLERRARAVRATARRRRVRQGAVALVGAMTLAAGGAAAHTGGAEPKSSTSSASPSKSVVAAVQAAIGVPADGVVGPVTRRALRAYQRSHGLPVTGRVDVATIRATGARASSVRRPAPGGSASAALDRIARCESGGNPRAVSADGRYRGKYQFSRATWKQMGGKGDPARASEAEQDRIAAALYAAQGGAPWPSCSG